MNQDFSKAAAVCCIDANWHSGLIPGVDVIPLESHGQNQGLDTFLARIPGGHSLPLPGEHAEVFVVSGTVSMNNIEYGPDTYFQLSHFGLVASSDAVLFVKLGSPVAQERAIDATASTWLPGESGSRFIPLCKQEQNQSMLMSWPDPQRGQFDCHFGGTEILVLEGTLTDSGTGYPALSWLRYPHRYQHTIEFSKGAKALVKTGHLPLPL